jgi:hypothetical protein
VTGTAGSVADALGPPLAVGLADVELGVVVALGEPAAGVDVLSHPAASNAVAARAAANRRCWATSGAGMNSSGTGRGMT